MRHVKNSGLDSPTGRKTTCDL